MEFLAFTPRLRIQIIFHQRKAHSNDEFRASSFMPSPSSTNLGYDPNISTAQCHWGNSQPSERDLTLQLHGNEDSLHYSTIHDTPETVGSSIPNEVVQDMPHLGNNFQLLAIDHTLQSNGNGDSLHGNTTHDTLETVGLDSYVYEELENITSFEDLINI